MTYPKPEVYQKVASQPTHWAGVMKQCCLLLKTSYEWFEELVPLESA
jgi:hypothetical protein